ncbi:MAG: phospholipase D-like domain-containing protein [Planctomycetota bacterium]
MVDIRFCGHDWEKRFVDVVRSAKHDLLLCSPYITQYACKVVAENISSDCCSSGSVRLITNLSPNAICQGATEPNAIEFVARQVRSVSVRHLPRLHAKVYVADERTAIVTSANMTAGGLRQNYEYGIQLSEPDAVASIRNDVIAYGDLGAHVNHAQLVRYCEIAQDVRSLYEHAHRSISSAVRRRFQSVLQSAEDELVRLRLAGGALHTVFAHSILFFLRKFGPLTTVQLHARIEAIHPDLCDNTIDRVIDGKRFGKKWKHAVRTAQQQLKKRGLISLREDRWYAISGFEKETTAQTPPV